MILRTGLVPALLGLTLAGSLPPGPAVAERAPTPGASGMGDPGPGQPAGELAFLRAQVPLLEVVPLKEGGGVPLEGGGHRGVVTRHNERGRLR
ncbi:hypothetical protein [Streptomyces fulvoviolaceus]|uniref:hypothetical protein n=1 Tax=Streptomyces fulvoviolaceus TaxID=285535 RepID=UPI0004C94F79|nr:hypothetical protein [Streptomyces fulvoviolaceus]